MGQVCSIIIISKINIIKVTVCLNCMRYNICMSKLQATICKLISFILYHFVLTKLKKGLVPSRVEKKSKFNYFFIKIQY